MVLRQTVAAVAAAMILSVPAAQARVTRIEVIQIEPPAPAARGGEATPPYERLNGRIHGELDPKDPKNTIITDLSLAPRNARGMVEYVATFSLMKPVDMSRASGVLMYTVVNRGNGQPAASAEGHVSLVSGWQGDVLSAANNQTIQVPVAKNTDGTSITGPLVIRFTGQMGTTATLMIPRNRVSPYPPASMDTKKASLVSAASESASGVKSGATTIASTDWAFADCATVPFPGTPDPTKICLKNSFDATRLYELRYTAKDPLVLGIGLAATRDINSFFRYEKQDDGGTPNPLAGRIAFAVAEGSSQSGTFLKLSLLLGFNQDERGRIVWEGMNPNIAARVTDLNRRFAFPGGLVGLYELGHEAPLWWEDWDDAPRGQGRTGMLDRCRATRTCPKIMETFGAAEFWGLRHSAVLVGTSAVADIPLPDNVRRYYFPGVSHGGGRGGFDAVTPRVPECDLALNPAPSAPMRSALLKRMVDWVTKGTPMPASKYPSIADHTLVANTNAAMGFPEIPGKPSPGGLAFPLLDYELGKHFMSRDESGFLTGFAAVKQTLPQLVPKVDADGNEVAGVKSPLEMAPLGTYTGWNVISSGVFKGQMCLLGGPVGGYIPFARTKAERLAAHDPRLSLEERYPTHEGYVRKVKEAADSLVKEGVLGASDAAEMVGQAEASTIPKP